MNAPIYLDYAATTPVHPDVARAMSEVLGGMPAPISTVRAPESPGAVRSTAAAGHSGVEITGFGEANFGNPASVTHVFGRRAEAQIEAARAMVAALIGASPADLVFTSGATESNNLALLGVARASATHARHLVTTKIEHKAVLDPCKQLEREGFTVTYVTPDTEGRVQPAAIRAALRADTALVSVMHVNNETGVIQDIQVIGETCRERGIAFHVDAAQSVGKLPVDVRSLPVDLLSFTAHKFYGPKGIGALYVHPAIRPRLRPVTFGGGQERGLRPGTLPTHQIVGFGAACKLAAASLGAEAARIEALRNRLWQALSRIDGVHLNGEAAPRLPGILNVSFEGVEGESLVTALTALAVSTGSACSSASGDPSYVLRALGRTTQLAQSSLRFSFGRLTTEGDIDAAAAAVQLQVGRLRAVSPAGSGKADAHRGGNTGSAPAPAGSQEADSVGAKLPGMAVAEAAPAALRAADGDTLSPLARRYFEGLPGAGAMPPGAGVIQGTAGSPAAEAWVRFHLRMEQGNVKAALFQAWGCPHTLAVMAWLTGQLPGRSMTSSLSEFVPGTPSAWLEALEVPVEKLGRLLIVEDALRESFRQWTEAHRNAVD